MTHKTILVSHATSIIRALAAVTVAAPPIQEMAASFDAALRNSIASRLESDGHLNDVMIVISDDTSAPNGKGWTGQEVQDVINNCSLSLTPIQQRDCLTETVLFAQLCVLESVLEKLEVPPEAIAGEIAQEIVDALAEQANAVAKAMMGPVRIAEVEAYAKQHEPSINQEVALRVLSMLLGSAGLTEDEIKAKLAAEGYEHIGTLEGGQAG